MVARALFTSAEVQNREFLECVRDCKVFLCSCRSIKGQEDNLCKTYWFTLSWLLLLKNQDVVPWWVWEERDASLSQRPSLRVKLVSRRSGVDSFPTGEGHRQCGESACLCPRCHWLAFLWTCKSHHLSTDASMKRATSLSNKLQMMEIT